MIRSCGYLRDINELQDYSKYVINTAQINEPTVGIINYPYITFPEPLAKTDYKILKTLNKDARKPLADIADEVGLSAKTVRKRINRMVENNLASFTIKAVPIHGEGLLTVYNIFLNEGTDIRSTIKTLIHNYSKNLVICLNFSNIPNLLLFETWTITIKESEEIHKTLQKEGFKDIIPQILLSVNHYDCWIDQMLRTK